MMQSRDTAIPVDVFLGSGADLTLTALRHSLWRKADTGESHRLEHVKPFDHRTHETPQPARRDILAAKR
jgi:hypothetical protein